MLCVFRFLNGAGGAAVVILDLESSSTLPATSSIASFNRGGASLMDVELKTFTVILRSRLNRFNIFDNSIRRQITNATNCRKD